jgi:serine/tyrosine/threonine adenylyltransferase
MPATSPATTGTISGKRTPIPFDNSYARLPAGFYARLDPTPVAKPEMIVFNRELALELGLDADALDSEAGAAIFGGNEVPEGAEPLAMAYAGHQFGQFVPQLGDGRAILLGEVIDSNGNRRDIQLKGSGPTPFSRRGDGRSALGPVLREYLVSEAMHALGVPTTRALAAVLTGEQVRREEMLPGGVITRVASSHVRVGTFQFFAARGGEDAVRMLADYVIDRHYPEIKIAEQPYLALLDAVMERQAQLIAKWMSIGFIHGVMNTDNTAISGETIDFGPCAFMDAYDPATVFSAIDQFGRYAYVNQARIAQWNLARLAETLLPLIDADTTRAVEQATVLVEAFPARFLGHWQVLMSRKIGLTTGEDGDLALIEELLDAMRENTADFTLTFRRLCDSALSPDADEAVQALFARPLAFQSWAVRWRQRLSRETTTPQERASAMRRANPAFIPRNHRVEQALEAGVERGDFAPFHKLLAIITRPYEDQPENVAYAEPPASGERVMQTFCGT